MNKKINHIKPPKFIFVVCVKVEGKRRVIDIFNNFEDATSCGNKLDDSLGKILPIFIDEFCINEMSSTCVSSPVETLYEDKTYEVEKAIVNFG